LTQLSLYGKAAKLKIEDVRLEQVVRFSQKGSMKDGTAESGCLALETHLDVDSDEPPERIRELVRMGERTCFTVQALMNPIPVRTHVKLKGEDLRLDEDDTD